MAANICPSCGAEIALDKISIAEGVGLCDSCGTLSRLSAIVGSVEQPWAASGEDVDADVDNPPAGCAIIDRGNEIIVRSSARSVGGAVGGMVFATFWNGIVSVFVLIAIAGLYTNITGRAVPGWFPAPMAGSSPNSLGGGMPLGMTLFLCVFLIPFVLVGTGMIFYVLLCIAGRVEVRLRGEEGRVRNAVGPLAWTRRFDAAKVKRVTIGHTTWKENDRSKPVICIDAERTIRVGSALREDRRRWMAAALHQLLVVPARGRRT